MKIIKQKEAVLFVVCCAVTLLLGSCATVNHLDEYRFGGTGIAGTMRTPPEPEIDGNYDVTVDMENPVLTFASVATNLAKANQLAKVEDKMYSALEQVDVPQIIFDETYERCSVTLASEKKQYVKDADYVFDLEIRDYGLSADSYGTTVRIEIATTARLYSTADRRLIWERRVSVSDPLSAEVFGLHDVLDTVISTAVIANLTEEQLVKGFSESARRISYKIANKLEDDIYDAIFD